MVHMTKHMSHGNMLDNTCIWKAFCFDFLQTNLLMLLLFVMFVGTDRNKTLKKRADAYMKQIPNIIELVTNASETAAVELSMIEQSRAEVSIWGCDEVDVTTSMCRSVAKFSCSIPFHRMR